MKTVKFLLSFIFVFLLTFVTFNTCLAQSATNVNLVIRSQDVYISPNEIIAGQPIKLYAMVSAEGNKDLNGEIKFFLGNVQIGETQPISIPSGGYEEEVFVKWVAPSRPFNFRVTAYSADETKGFANDNEALSAMIYPLADQDQDTIPDIRDNCIEHENPNQLDQDENGIGDVCDEEFQLVLKQKKKKEKLKKLKKQKKRKNVLRKKKQNV